MEEEGQSEVVRSGDSESLHSAEKVRTKPIKEKNSSPQREIKRTVL